jgi:hypothetical protein
LVSSQPLRVFGAALSPDQLPRHAALCLRTVRRENRSAANWCGRRESNPDLESGALVLCPRAAPAWWGMGRVERLAAEGRRLQRRDGTARPYWHSPESMFTRLVAGRGVEPRAERRMRPPGPPGLPARNGGGRGSRTRNLAVGPVFEAGCAPRRATLLFLPVHARRLHTRANWPSRGDSNTRPHGSEPCALSI